MNSLGHYLQPTYVLTTFIRNFGKNRGRKLYVYPGEGIKYYGFTYYPRYPDFKETPYEPTKLFRVQRIKPVKGTPKWERTILEQLKLTGKMTDVAIIKNIPENNHKLWKIKHLIKISPITFPDGFPEDTKGTYLMENGQLRVTKTIGVEKQVQALDAFKNDPKKMDGDTLRRGLRLKWLHGWTTVNNQ